MKTIIEEYSFKGTKFKEETIILIEYKDNLIFNVITCSNFDKKGIDNYMGLSHWDGFFNENDENSQCLYNCGSGGHEWGKKIEIQGDCWVIDQRLFEIQHNNGSFIEKPKEIRGETNPFKIGEIVERYEYCENCGIESSVEFCKECKYEDEDGDLRWKENDKHAE